MSCSQGARPEIRMCVADRVDPTYTICRGYGPLGGQDIALIPTRVGMNRPGVLCYGPGDTDPHTRGDEPPFGVRRNVRVS